MLEHLRQLEQPRPTGTVNKTSTLAARLTDYNLSTSLSPWVNDKLGSVDDIATPPLVVFPEEIGAYQYIFPDTVVVKLPVQLLVKSFNGKETLQPLDPKAASNYIKDLFGVVGDYASIQRIPGTESLGMQEYYISTCNIPLRTVHNICKDIKEGKYLYNGTPVELVRLDVTTNVPAAVAPSDTGLVPCWEYKNNSKFVGDCCHSYVVLPGSIETKIYDKFLYMLEVGAVAKQVGNNIPNLLNSPQDNIRLAFRSPLFQQQGFGRVETRFWQLPSLERLVEFHTSYVAILVSVHCQPTSLQDSWNCFLQPNHSQTMVINYNKATNQYTWTLARWVNKNTDKLNGVEGVGLETAEYALKQHSMGKYPVNCYYTVTDQDKKCNIVSSAVFLPDTLHTALLVSIVTNGNSKAKLVSSGYSWEDIGLDIPFSLANTNGKGRHLKVRGTPELPMESAPIPSTLESNATLEKKAKKAEAQRVKRELVEYDKQLAKVVLDKYKTIPADFRKHYHLSELAKVAKPICTKYVFHSECRYPCWMVLVGTKWYKANTKLGRMLEKTPELPLVIEVWDSGTIFNDNKVWEVSCKTLPRP